jgi:hypothetical protein
MNDDNSLVSALRVRIQTADNLHEISELFDDLIKLGHKASALMPIIKHNIEKFKNTPNFYRLIINLKSSELLDAAHHSDFIFYPEQQAELLDAGFSMYERKLVDRLYAMRYDETFPFGNQMLEVISKCGHEKNTLEVLEVLEATLTKKELHLRSKLNEEKRRVELKEMDYEDIPFSRMDALVFFEFLENLKSTIKILNSRELADENIQKWVSRSPFDMENILSLIQALESEKLEFKSTLRYDLMENKVNTKLEKVIVKTIAAFANSLGGDIIIGVSDDKEILGLDKDYISLNNGNSDKFQLKIREILANEIGQLFVINNINISFHSITGKEVCKISVFPSKKPIYISENDKSGNKQERFFVRSGNSSIPLSLKDSNEFIAKRFCT